jgi:cytochrome P450
VMSILGMDPPRQKRLRSLVSRGFTPRRVHDLLPRIQQLTDRYLAECLEMGRDGGEFDWIADFAGKLPMDVISEMMGVPEDDRAEVRRQADTVVHREDGVYDVPPPAMDSSLWLVGYYQDMVDQRRRAPSDDLTSALIEAEVDGERLTDEDVIAFLFLMVVAGNETTTKLLGHALFHLTDQPDQLAKVFDGPDGAGDRELVSPWIEETLRYDTSSQLLARYLLKDVELHGTVAPQGSKLLLCLGSANRDERVFSRPGDYDIFRDRDELAQILSFGGGRHFCLGANLARLETRVALTTFVERVRSVEVAHERCERVHSLNVRGFAAMPTRVEVR